MKLVSVQIDNFAIFILLLFSSALKICKFCIVLDFNIILILYYFQTIKDTNKNNRNLKI